MSKRPVAPALVHVTDHAVVRYLQRVENHDVDLVREVIRLRVEPGRRLAKRWHLVGGDAS